MLISSMHGHLVPWCGDTHVFVGRMASCKYEKGPIFRTLRLHKYNKVDMHRRVPKHNNYEDFASIMRESMKA